MSHILVSPLLSTQERPWPAPDEFGNAGNRQNNFSESGATIFHSTRSCGLNIRAVWSRSPARVRILPRRTRCGNHFLHPKAFRHGDPVTAVDRISVAQEISASVLPRKRLPDLLHRPLLGGVFGHLEVQHAAPSMRQHNEHKQNPEGRRRHHKEVDRGHLFQVIGQEGSPSLGRRLPRAAKIFGHRRLCYLDP